MDPFEEFEKTWSGYAQKIDVLAKEEAKTSQKLARVLVELQAFRLQGEEGNGWSGFLVKSCYACASNVCRYK